MVRLVNITLCNCLLNSSVLLEAKFGLVSSRVNLTSWGIGTTLALVDDLSSDSVTIKMSYRVDVLHRPASHSIFSYWVG